MLNFKIITPERKVHEDTVDSITLPAEGGEITILPNHVPLISLLQAGVITLKKGSEEYHLASSGGFVEVLSNSRVVVLADTAERAEELIAEAVEEARLKAKEAVTQAKAQDDVAQAAALSHLEREIARLRAIKRKDSRKHSSKAL